MKKKYNFFITGMFILMGMLSFLIEPVYAAERSMEKHKIETMTVTAEKTASNIQKVTTSISAFSEGNLNDSGIADIEESARFAPNVYINRESMIIRGVSSFYGSKISGVGIYQDGIYLPFDGMDNADLFDVERIEILKGPQGTLYGKNSEAGVVNIITKKPENKFSAKVFGEYSWYDTDFGNNPGYMAGGAVNTPVIDDRLYFRIAGNLKDYSGFMKNVNNGDEDAGEEKIINGRASLRFIPDDKWNISLITDVFDKDCSDVYFKYVTGQLDEGRHRVSYDGPYEGDRQGNGQTVKVENSGDKINFVSITGRRTLEKEYDGDFDLTSVISPWTSTTYVTDENTEYSQELRISSPKKHDDFKWLAGIYTYDQEMDIYQIKNFVGSYQARSTSIDNYGYAFFGQGTYTFFEKLSLTAGIRYDFTDSEGEQLLETSSGDSTYGKSFDNKEFLPKFAVSYDFSDKIMAYTSFTKGYLTGGYNAKWATNESNLTYDPEYTWNYEIGIKSSWLDNRLIANLSAFYIEMEDKQVAQWDTSSGSVSVQQIQNAANAYSKGVEMDITAKPFAGLDLFAGLGFTEARIDDWVATEYDSVTQKQYKYDYTDKRLPNVPEYTYNLGAQYRIISGLFFRADFLGTGSLYSDSKNSAKEDGYEIVNLRLGYETDKFDIIFWCKNLLDEEYLKARFASSGDDQGVEGDPRMIGTTVRFRF